MKNITIKAYQLSELSEQAKENFCNRYRAEGKVFDDHIHDEFNASIKAFREFYGLKQDRMENDSLAYLKDFDEDIENLKGLRLRTYIINNYPSIVRGKYYSLWSKTEKANNPYGGKLKQRYSKVMFEYSCPLTGIYCDHNILQPIYDFIYKYSERSGEYSQTDIYDLFDECFNQCQFAYDNALEYQNSNEAIIEDIEANNPHALYTEDGEEIDFEFEEITEETPSFNPPQYILYEDSIHIVNSHGVEIPDEIFDNELFEYRIIDRESFIRDDLTMWIAEAKDESDKTLMLDDLIMLSELNDDYIFSSISTNEYIHSNSPEFNKTCEELIQLVENTEEEE